MEKTRPTSKNSRTIPKELQFKSSLRLLLCFRKKFTPFTFVLSQKFKSWGPRTNFYRSRPKVFENGLRKPGTLPFTCSVDLTKRRFNLLRDVRGIIKHYPEINYAFADVNCSLGIRMHDNKCVYFNDKSKLDEILGKLD